MGVRVFFVILFSSFLSFAQTIEGTVLEANTKKPLARVNVYLNTSKKGTVTNANGNFKISVKLAVKDTLFFSYLGYKTNHLTFSEIKRKKITLYLEKDVEKLNEVSVFVEKKLNPKIKFTKLESLQEGLYSFGSVLMNDQIFVIGGDESFKADKGLKTFSDHPELMLPQTKLKDFLEKHRLETSSSRNKYSGQLQVYDTSLKSWKDSKLEFRKRANHNLNYYKGKIYVLGGKFMSTNNRYEYLDNTIEVYDIKNNTVSIDYTNPHQAVDFLSFTYKNHIIVMGGCIKTGKKGKVYSKKVHLYNLETGLWYELEDMPKGKGLNGVLVNTKIYVTGKFEGNRSLEMKTFDLMTGQWEKEGELAKELNNPAITYNNGSIYLFEYGKLFTYDVNTKELNKYSINLFLEGSTLYTVANKLYILGGFEEDRISKTPSSGFFSIDLDELQNTKIQESKTL